VRARGFITLTLILALFAAVATTAQADRRATAKEHRQVAAVVDLPPKCAKVRVSTVTPKPKWASVAFKPGSSSCEPFGRDGVTIAKKKSGTWSSITAGSDFECASLYTQVPKAVVQDLGITCR
jgi:hypothetical protein